jgi:glycosyltransferase involved in cell wall biosynthesis
MPGGGGATRYAIELLRALRESAPEVEVVAFVTRDAPPELLEAPWARDIRFVVLPVPAQRKGAAVFSLGGLTPLALAHRVDVLHSLAGVGPPGVPRLLPTVVTLLDVIWLLLPDQVSMTAAERASWIRNTRRSTRLATRVIAISQAAADDIVGAYGLDPRKVDVTPLGVRFGGANAVTPEPELRGRLGLGAGRVLLSVGQQQPYKAQAELIRALAALGEPDVVLALPGAPTGYGEELERLARELGVAERARMLGFVSDPDVEGLYAVATAILQPSRMEGFGLPALEALRRGKPVACSGRSALGEVVGDAALLLDPDDLGSVVTAMRRLLDDAELRADLARRGPPRAAAYTWEATAAATLASYRRAIGAG